MSVVQIVLGVLAFAAASVAGAVWAFQTYGMYRFDPRPNSPGEFGLPSTVRVVRYTSEDGAPVHAWIADPAKGLPVILSFYGNQSCIGGSMGRLSRLIQAGYGIMMMEYRGSGGTPGKPSAANFARDARALYDQMDALLGEVIPTDRRVLYGFSLGAGVASRLAEERSFSAAIFEAAPYRTCLFYEDRYFGFPLCRLMWSERYDIIDHLRNVRVPKLLVHGRLDRSLPVERARRLFQEAPEPKQYVELPGGGHADLHEYGLIPAIESFLQQQLRPVVQ